MRQDPPSQPASQLQPASQPAIICFDGKAIPLFIFAVRTPRALLD
jgi:hypothetical protein